MNPQVLAARLLAVREGAPLLEDITEEERPGSVAEAYEVADLLVAALQSRHGPVAGYKVGATSLTGQLMLDLGEPFYGRTFEHCIVTDAQEWVFSERPCTLEPEVGFVLTADLPPRSHSYSLSEVQAAIGVLVPLLEVNRPAFAKPFDIGGPCLIADNGVTQGFIIGARGMPLSEIPNLAAESVNLSRNGRASGSGAANAVLGNPLHAVMWLANKLREQGRGLKAGDVIASGAMSKHIDVALGDHVEAHFSTLGELKVTVGRER